MSLATNIEAVSTHDEHHSCTLRQQTRAVAHRQLHSAQTKLLANTPYTLAAALQPNRTQCRLVFSVPSMSIVFASDAFADRVGTVMAASGLEFLAGSATDVSTLDTLASAARAGCKSAGVTTVYPAAERPCHAHLQVSPLLGPEGQLDHALLVMTPLLCDVEEL